jgi:HrpA-like RNA helicase
MLVGRSKLPVFAERERILAEFDKHSVIVISGATGCGKSTQIPQFILEHIDNLYANGQSSDQPDNQVMDGEIICTQPRRISATSLAERVAAERGETVGQTVGYQIRLEKRASKHSRIMFCTVGILLRRLQNDPLLSNVSTLIIDEVHERERNCDFLLNILHDLVESKKRTNLKIVLMSATVNSELFSKYFFNCPHLFCPGFTYPVQLIHLAISQTIN